MAGWCFFGYGIGLQGLRIFPDFEDNSVIPVEGTSPQSGLPSCDGREKSVSQVSPQ
ncbi:hypothetical protein THTE_3586 [Thermogutta terrifontis]|uniref:Uncharacterized protein n=1 Tax=Thermogutta terrifontis TaxID=1331910 RepID=A0A286RJP9_9BACT|nr:hypothetical protein THTE_3586 [Thermogutta terrifontis]